MIDIHCHVLPGIDDGAETLEEAIEFCRIAAEDGIRTLVATPHMRDDTYPNSPGAIRIAHQQFAARLAGEDIPIRLHLGAEVHLAPDLPKRFRSGALMTYADRGKFLLLELPYQQFPAGVEDVVFQLRLLGITPVLAHPERIAFFFDDPARLGRLRELGAVTQFTASSITGRFGEEVQEFSFEMIRRGWVDSLASDAHDLQFRPPKLAEAVNRVAEWIGPESARRMVEEVPRAILEGRELEPVPVPSPREPGRPRLWRWFRRRGAGSGS